MVEFPLFEARQVFESAGFVSAGLVDVVDVGAVCLLGDGGELVVDGHYVVFGLVGLHFRQILCNSNYFFYWLLNCIYCLLNFRDFLLFELNFLHVLS